MSKPLAFCLVAAALSLGCAGKPAAPFDTLKTSNLTAFRLQNNDTAPAVAATPAPGAAAGTPVIPGLDPNLQNSITAGVQALQKLIPPGLQIPGLALPGAAGVPGVTPVADTTPRFQTFKILAQQQVLDNELKEDLGKLLGDKDNFDNTYARCAPNVFFPEYGLSFASAPGAQSNDLLVSLACNQVVSRTFSWPYPSTGMKISTHSDLNELLVKIFPQGT